jgi:trimeric autotransporter adhesin
MNYLLLRCHRYKYARRICGDGSMPIALKHLLISLAMVPMIATTSLNLRSSTAAGVATGIGSRASPRPLTVTSWQKVRLVASNLAIPAKGAAVSLVVHSLIRPIPPGEIVSINVSPSDAALNRGQSATFAAKVSGTSEDQVTWSLSPQVGTIANGVYQAPTILTAPQTVTVTAKSLADPTVTASATIFLQLVKLAIGPASLSLEAGKSTTLTASVTGTANTAVSWSLSPQVGTITNGVYQAPAIIPNQQNVTVTTTSVADSTKSASVILSLIPVG